MNVNESQAAYFLFLRMSAPRVDAAGLDGLESVFLFFVFQSVDAAGLDVLESVFLFFVSFSVALRL